MCVQISAHAVGHRSAISRYLRSVCVQQWGERQVGPRAREDLGYRVAIDNGDTAIRA